MPIIRFICSECGPGDGPCIHWERQEIKKELRFLSLSVLEIIHLLKQQSGFSVVQIQGDVTMPITGIVAGETGTFKESPLPQGATIPAGTIPVWSSSDTTNAPVTASADGTTCTVAVPATATITTFNLTVANQDGSFATTVAVPVIVAQTGFAIDQVS